MLNHDAKSFRKTTILIMKNVEMMGGDAVGGDDVEDDETKTEEYVTSCGPRCDMSAHKGMSLKSGMERHAVIRTYGTRNCP